MYVIRPFQGHAKLVNPFRRVSPDAIKFVPFRDEDEIRSPALSETISFLTFRDSEVPRKRSFQLLGCS